MIHDLVHGQTRREDKCLAKVNTSYPETENEAVRKAGADRITRSFDTQHEAIDAARDIARNQETELYIHGRDGRIREWDSYGKDPFPPKG